VRNWLVAVALVSTAVAAEGLSRGDADSLQTKLALIGEAGKGSRAPGAPPLRTAFTDREVNAYLQFYGPMFLPAGISQPRLASGDHGHVKARGVVDLDAVRTAQERGWFDPLAYVTGSLEVVATGFFEGTNGRGVVHFESATVAGASVPRAVLEEILRFYTSTPERPAGFQFDEPFELPANIRSVTVAASQTTVVQ
jgi:hypothetical protein